MLREDLRVGMTVEIQNQGNVQNEYKGKRGRVLEIMPNPFYDVALEIDGERLCGQAHSLEEVIFEKLQPGTEVIYNGQYRGEVIGTAEIPDLKGREVAITYENGGEIINSVVEREKIRKVKGAEDLVAGDEFITYYDNKYTVLGRHRDPSNELWYFVEDDEGFCEMESAEEIAEVL